MPISSTPPTKDATWATDADTTLEPSSPKKALGWVLGERPGFNVFNYWMNLVYLWLVYAKNALTEIDSTKFEKTGGTITGNVLPDGDGTRTLGDAAHRWDVFADTISVGEVGTPGSVIPGAVTGCALGDSGHLFDANLRNVEIAGSYNLSGTLASSIVPAGGAGATFDVGGGATTTVRGVHAEETRCYDTDQSPASQAELLKRNQQNIVLACGTFDGTDGSLDGDRWNVNSVSRSDVGLYVVTLDQGVDVYCACAIGIVDSGLGATDLVGASYNSMGGTTFVIRVTKLSGGTVAGFDAGAVSFVITGRPETLQ